MIKFDLTPYQCPQLFVQFKYQLKRVIAKNNQQLTLTGEMTQEDELCHVITFLHLQEVDITDIENYLKLHRFKYQINCYMHNKELLVNLKNH
ncbi:hypothetical protein [Pseudoalteromonas denitrificans]|uniref:Uncharacterized protein n=1 Tax=Pseudoalteromonas denitrificans DSM 6059 TaxID=1123010 RepID=A0A1I1KWS5_9GAMM|nr:hypothetical protein [Pseudoalteromonas denitrificans]SFC65254.1 hypothetical protein SAMN02745724_02198 [Pseudoalteromonas denitrificans DSM 6059]